MIGNWSEEGEKWNLPNGRYRTKQTGHRIEKKLTGQWVCRAFVGNRSEEREL